MFQWVKCYVEPSSTVDGRLINEMREVRFKEGFECLIALFEHINRFGKVNGRKRSVARLVVKHLWILQIQFFIALEKVMNGLFLLNVCLKDIPCVNQQKLWALLGLHYSIVFRKLNLSQLLIKM